MGSVAGLSHRIGLLVLACVAACGGAAKGGGSAATAVVPPAASSGAAPLVSAAWPLGTSPPAPAWCAPPPAKDAPELLAQLGPSGLIWGVELTPDGSGAVLVEGGRASNRDIRLWDVRSAAMRAVYRGHRHIVSSVSFHPTTPVFVSTANDEPARLWDARTGASRELEETAQAPYPLTARFSPDGQTIALGYKSGVKLLTATGELRASLDAPDWNSIAFSADSRSLLTYGPEINARDQLAVWDVATGTARLHVPKGPRSTHNAGIAPDGRFVVWAPFEGPATITDVATGQVRATLQTRGSIEVVEVSRDGRTVMVGGDGISVFDTTTGQKVADHPDLMGYHAKLLPDGLIATHKSRHGAVLLRGGTRLELAGAPHDEVMAFALTPDGSSVIGAVGLGTPDAVVWDARTGARRSTIRNQRLRIKRMAWSPDATQIAVLLGEGNGPADQAAILDLRSGVVRALGVRARADMLETLAWSPAGDVIAAGTVFEASLYDARTGGLLRQLESDEQFHATHEVGFLPGGRVVTSASKSFTINELRYYDARTFARQRTDPSPVGHVHALAVSPDGTRLAVVGAGAVAVVDPQTGATIAKVTGAGNTLDVAWLPDGSAIATIADRGPLALWDARTGAQLAVLSEQASKPELGGRLAVSRDGRVLVSGSEGGVRLWDLRTRTMLTKIDGELDSVGAIRAAPTGDVIAVARNGIQLVRMRDGQSVLARIVDVAGAEPSGLFTTTSGLFAGPAQALSLLRVRQGPDLVFSPLVGVEQSRAYRPNLVGELFGGCWLTTP